MSEEELQKHIEQEGAPSTIDGRVYKHVFKALRQAPDFTLSPSFADRVVSRIEPAKESKSEIVWMVVGIVSFVITALVAAVMSNYTLNFGVLKFISGYPGLVAFGAALILVLHWVDKRFVRKSSVI